MSNPENTYSNQGDNSGNKSSNLGNASSHPGSRSSNAENKTLKDESKTLLSLPFVLAKTAAVAIVALTLAIHNYRDYNLEMEHDLMKLDFDIKQQLQDNAILDEAISTLKTCISSRVVFHASVKCTASNILEMDDQDKRLFCLPQLRSGTVVAWDNVTMNLGGGYNVASGEFTCPSNGRYYFYAHVMSAFDYETAKVCACSDPETKVCLQLEVNGKFLTSLFIDNNDPYVNDGSMSAVVVMRKGDAVRVKATCDTYVEQGFYYHAINYFMGHLISADTCTP